MSLILEEAQDLLVAKQEHPMRESDRSLILDHEQQRTKWGVQKRKAEQHLLLRIELDEAASVLWQQDLQICGP